MDEFERQVRQRLKDNFPHYAAKCLKIRLKTGGIEPFLLNQAQLYINHRLEKQKRRKGKIRAIILKGRQQGCSTYVAGRFYWNISHRYGMNAFVLTHLEEAAKNIYKIVRRFHDYCPRLVRPQAAIANNKELILDILNSSYKIGSAKSQGVGRSETIQLFHGSEVAYWAQATTHMSGILQAVPDMEGTEIILESTSNGGTGLFYKMCMEAEAGTIPYELIFVPWFWQSEYSVKIDKKIALTDEEKSYMQEYSLKLEQILWRRAKIAELGSIWAFRREYPSTIEEAFHSDNPNALWSRELLEKNRVTDKKLPPLQRIVIAIDPATTSNSNSDETGIIVAGLGEDGHGYVLEDASGKYSPASWAKKAIFLFDKYNADRIVAEVNQGGDMVEHTIRTQRADIAYKSLRASRGKFTRAEPIAALDEQGKIHHVGVFGKLEDQLCAFTPQGQESSSPDRADARVWAMSELMLGKKNAIPLIW